ncbi:MAG: hypothetical protein HY519_02935 [Candidatus Aenigmarchaeota archaeon]|nr:hypothetical protein [Candidatus Aenigmarchaeota archaeon]
MKYHPENIDEIVAQLPEAAPEFVQELRNLAEALAPSNFEWLKVITAADNRAKFRVTQGEELRVLADLARFSGNPGLAADNIAEYFRMRPDDMEKTATFYRALSATLGQIAAADGSRKLEDYENREAIVRQLKKAYDGEEHLPFWEDYLDWESVIQEGNDVSHTSSSAYLVADPETGIQYVVKTKDLDAEESISDPRKIAIFQEIARFYGVPAAEEIVVLPSKELAKAKVRAQYLRTERGKDGYTEHMSKWPAMYERIKAHGLRVARYAEELRQASTLRGKSRQLTEGEISICENWFPGAIFDDRWGYEVESFETKNIGDNIVPVTFTHNEGFFTVNPEKFRSWYEKADISQRQRARSSLAAMNSVIRSGFLIDVFGQNNMTFHNGQFYLMDVEPISLANLPRDTVCISSSQNTLNDLFKVVDLPPIAYSDAVSTNYGNDKYLKMASSWNATYSRSGVLSRPSEFWETNVSSQEELELYRERFARIMGSRPSYRSAFPPQLNMLLRDLLEKPDSFFADQRFDWNYGYRK